MKDCVIFGASPDAIVPDGFSAERCLVLCADGGLDLALSMGIRPDVVIGDMDSVSAPRAGDWESVVLPREKDDTDMMAAIKLGLSRGCRSFRLLGALGGRSDHTYGNLSVLFYLAEHGAEGVLCQGREQVVLRRAGESLSLQGKRGATVSVFPFGMERCTLTYQGLKYPLEHGTLTIAEPIGISNTIIAPEARIIVEDGTAVIFIHQN